MSIEVELFLECDRGSVFHGMVTFQVKPEIGERILRPENLGTTLGPRYYKVTRITHRLSKEDWPYMAIVAYEDEPSYVWPTPAPVDSPD